ncbi:MAG: Menaquinone via futalosine step 3, partial [uncultured Campylobacterales bacterium]
MTRLTKKEALDLFQNESLLNLGIQANNIKKFKHPDDTVSFIVDRNINYTNICWVDCKFCAFYRHAKDDDAYI